MICKLINMVIDIHIYVYVYLYLYPTYTYLMSFLQKCWQVLNQVEKYTAFFP